MWKKRIRNTKCEMKECKFTSNLKSLIVHFLSKMAHHFLLNLTFLNVLLLVLTFRCLVKREQSENTI